MSEKVCEEKKSLCLKIVVSQGIFGGLFTEIKLLGYKSYFSENTEYRFMWLLHLEKRRLFQCLNGLQELERDFGERHGVTRQGGMSLN